MRMLIDVAMFPDEEEKEKEDETGGNAFDSDDVDFHDTSMLNTPSLSNFKSNLYKILKECYQSLQLELIMLMFLLVLK